MAAAGCGAGQARTTPRIARPALIPAQNAELAGAYEHCRNVAKHEAKNFYYGFLALPSYKRNAMCAVYAFMRRADDISDDESFTLEERREEMTHWLAAWHGIEPVRRQDRQVFLAVRDVQSRFGVPGELLDKLVQGTTMDLEPEPPSGVRRVVVGERTFEQYETMQALERYCYLVASVVGLVTIRIFGCRDPRADAYAEQMGLAFQLTNILRDVKEDAERGRIYLPEELLLKHGLESESVIAASRTGSTSRAMRALLDDVAASADRLYRARIPLIPMLAPDSRAAMGVLVQIYHLLLRRIVASRYQVFARRIKVSTPRKLTVLAGGLISGLLARLSSEPEAQP